MQYVYGMVIALFITLFVIQCGSCRCTEGCMTFAERCKETDIGCQKLAVECLHSCKWNLVNLSTNAEKIPVEKPEVK